MPTPAAATRRTCAPPARCTAGRGRGLPRAEAPNSGPRLSAARRPQREPRSAAITERPGRAAAPPPLPLRWADGGLRGRPLTPPHRRPRVAAAPPCPQAPTAAGTGALGAVRGASRGGPVGRGRGTGCWCPGGAAHLRHGHQPPLFASVRSAFLFQTPRFRTPVSPNFTFLPRRCEDGGAAKPRCPRGCLRVGVRVWAQPRGTPGDRDPRACTQPSSGLAALPRALPESAQSAPTAKKPELIPQPGSTLTGTGASPPPSPRDRRPGRAGRGPAALAINIHEARRPAWRGRGRGATSCAQPLPGSPRGSQVAGSRPGGAWRGSAARERPG